MSEVAKVISDCKSLRSLDLSGVELDEAQEIASYLYRSVDELVMPKE